MKKYRIFGLNIRSEVDLPEAAIKMGDGTSAAKTDVTVQLQTVPSSLTNSTKLGDFFEVTENACLFKVPQVGKFLVRNGNSVLIDPHSSALSRNIRVFLLGSVFGTILHQRKQVPLHVSGVKTPEGIVAFTGPSGAGKSTIVAELNEISGWPVFCDDLAVLKVWPEQATLHAGLTRLKLWRDALERLNLVEKKMEHDFFRADKFHVSVPGQFSSSEGELIALVQIEEAEQTSVLRLGGHTAFEAFQQSIYRREMFEIFGDQLETAKTLISAMSQVRVLRLARPKRAPSTARCLDLLVEALA